MLRAIVIAVERFYPFRCHPAGDDQRFVAVWTVRPVVVPVARHDGDELTRNEATVGRDDYLPTLG